MRIIRVLITAWRHQMKSLLTIMGLLTSFTTMAGNPKIINCSLGSNYDYSVLIDLTSKKVELWEMAGSGVAYPSLASDIIIKQEIKGNTLTVETKKTGLISINTFWKQGGWGNGNWKHNYQLDSKLVYADSESNSNGNAILFECVDWANN